MSIAIVNNRAAIDMLIESLIMPMMMLSKSSKASPISKIEAIVSRMSSIVLS